MTKLLPTPPTDNIHKFMALAGTWMLVGLIAFLVGFQVFVYTSDLQNKRAHAYFQAESKVIDIDKRLKALDGGADFPTPHWVERGFETVAKEREWLGMLKLSFKRNAERNKPYAEDETLMLVWDFLNKMDRFVQISLILYIFVMGWLSWFGYRNWWGVQRINDEYRRAELKLIERQLSKLH